MLFNFCVNFINYYIVTIGNVRAACAQSFAL